MGSNGNSYNGKYTAQQFIDAIPESGGVVSTIAARVGCAWDTAKKYIDKYATVKQAYDNERARVNDVAKHNIVAAIEGGDLHMSKWWLQVMDAEFREIQRHEVTGKDGGPLIVRYVDDWRSPVTEAS